MEGSELDYAEAKRRLLDRIDKNLETGCWNWMMQINEYGYGRICFKGVDYYAHRLSFLVFNGPIPATLCVSHDCDNSKCINPAHLKVESISLNVAKANRKRGRAWGGDAIGEPRINTGGPQ